MEDLDEERLLDLEDLERERLVSLEVGVLLRWNRGVISGKDCPGIGVGGLGSSAAAFIPPSVLHSICLTAFSFSKLCSITLKKKLIEVNIN